MKNVIFLIGYLSLLNASWGLDNGLALTPPMGWLSWERFRCIVDCDLYPEECISETLFKRIADQLAKGGYLEAGYEYIIIDDCWASKERDDENRLQADPERFPSGIQALADYVHNLGLKMGIYGDYGTFTCGGYPGSIDHLQLDADTFAEWGIDYLKLDGCYAELEGMEEGYAKMARYLNATGRPIVFSCSFPAYEGLDTNYSMAVENCNLWRNYDDIDDSWESVRDIFKWFNNNQDYLRQFAGPGHWNDPDMLIIGNFGLSFEQAKAQMTIWSIMAAPLIMSVDLDTIELRFKNILLNKDAVRINQDPLGIPGELISNVSDILLWRRPLSDDGVALGVVSTRVDGYPYLYDIVLDDFLQNYVEYNVVDVFSDANEAKQSVHLKSDIITIRVPPTGGILLLITPVALIN